MAGSKRAGREWASRAKEQGFLLGAAGSRWQVDILQDGFPSSKGQGSMLAL